MLYRKLEEDFDRHDGALVGYGVDTPATPLAIRKHYDIRAFHNDDIVIPWTINDMRYYNAFNFLGMSMDELQAGRSSAGREYRKRQMGELNLFTMGELQNDSMFDIENVIVALGNEEWPIDPAVVVGKDSGYRWANSLRVSLSNGVPKTIHSYYTDDLLTDFNVPGEKYFLELVLRSFPAQSGSPRLDLLSSYIEFEDVNGATDRILFGDSINSLGGGGDTYLRVNRDVLENLDLTQIKRITFRLLSIGNMTFIAQAFRLVPEDYTFPIIDPDTKRFQLTRTVPRIGTPEGTASESRLFFDHSRPQNMTYYIRFNSGHNPVGNDNVLRFFTRYDPLSGDNINVRLFARSTQSRLRIYQTQNSVETEIFSTAINTNILTPETQYTLKIDVINDQVKAEIWTGSGVFLETLVYGTGWQTIAEAGRGYVGYSFEPYNYDFRLDAIAPSNVTFASFETTPHLSMTPVKGATLIARNSQPVALLNAATLAPDGDAILSDATIGRPSPSIEVKRSGTGWIGGIKYDDVIVNTSEEATVSGDIFPIGPIRGKYRAALVDVDGSVAWLGHIKDLLSDQWNHFEVPVTSGLMARGYYLHLHQAGFYDDTYYLDNVSVNHRSIGWAAANDAVGVEWHNFLAAINGRYTGLNFPTPGRSLKVRARAYSDTAWIAGYELIPRYVT